MMLDLRLDLKRIGRVLLATLVFLFAVNILVWCLNYFWGMEKVGGFLRLLDFDEEANIPTFFNFSLFVLCGLTFFLIGLKESAASRKRMGRTWRVISYFTFYAAADEFTQIHEMAIEPIRDMFNLSGFLYYPWIIPAVIFLLVGAFCLRGFFRRLPDWYKKRLFLGVGISLLGAIGMEAAGGYYWSTYEDIFIYKVFFTSVEEFLEMLGLIFILIASLGYLSRISLKVST